MNRSQTPKSPVPPTPRGQRGIQSVEVGGQLLRSLVQHGRAMALKDLARAAGMPPARAHPYLVSFGKLGLIEQDGASARYRLGPLALQLGLISLQQFDPVRLATPHLPGLAQAIGHTVALAVWGNRGPTIVRVEEAPSAVHVNMRHGTVMSLRNTASGRLFAAHLPAAQVRAALAEEDAHARRTGAAQAPSRARENARAGAGGHSAFLQQLKAVRAAGLSHVIDALLPGISALAAPVFDQSGSIVLSLTAIGSSPTFDARPEGATALALLACARQLSQQLGALGPAQAPG